MSNDLFELCGGDLVIRWPSPTSTVIMTGDAVRVFDGEIEL